VTTNLATDSANPAVPETARHFDRSTVRDFLELAKARISVMVVLTVAVAGLISLPIALPGTGWTLVHAMLGLMFVSASGCAFNQYLERYVDWLMPRTAKRPLPAQRLSALQVAVFGAVTFGIGMAWLIALTNWQSAAIAAVNWFIYVWVYTPLKLRTWLNTYVGAVAGGLPILIGSTAVSDGAISVGAWLLFAVLFLWQFPHFMAIAWLYRADYRAANVKMATTVDDSGRLAAWHAVLFAIALIPLTAYAMVQASGLPLVLSGSLLLLVTVLLGAWYLQASIQFAKQVNVANSKRLFRVSLVYLTAYLVLVSLAATL